MEFFNWVHEREYEDERELLRSMLVHTESWYNELTLPLKDLLFAMRSPLANETQLTLGRSDFNTIAADLYFRKIESNHGNHLESTIEQFQKEGIPLFDSRYKLRRRTQEFLESGRFIKNIASMPRNWGQLNAHQKYILAESIKEGWEKFKLAKQQLVTEINRQIRYAKVPQQTSMNKQLTSTVLFLAADPKDATRLRLGEEIREINEKLQLAKLRDHFTLEQRHSVRPSDLTQALLDTEPAIVHFSGHGTASGELCFEGSEGKIHPISIESLSNLFGQFSEQVRCVILNACYSEAQAEIIAKHVKYVIGTNKAIGDAAAIAFSIGFYQAVGAGRSIKQAYNLGCVQIQLQNIPEHMTPVLIEQAVVT